MLVTVAICTWNRAALLDQTLAQMRQLVVPAGVEWELLVVNNNCTDDTEQVVARHAGALPARHLLERKQGQSSARNCAAAAAAGEFILWTDDDVLVGPNWLAAYAEAFARWPRATVFGGPVRPWFQGQPPAWLRRVWPRVAHAYAVREFGAEPVALSPEVLPFGANYAVRTDEQRRYPYDPELGLKANGTLRGEEVSVLCRMFADGAEGRWVPDAVVSHYLPRSRQTVGYLRGFYRGQGEFLAREAEGDDSPRLFGKPRWLWRKALAAEARYRCQRLFSPPEVWVKGLVAASTWWGRLRGFRPEARPADALPAVPAGLTAAER